MDDSTVDQQGMHVSTPMQVEIESEALQPSTEAVAANPGAMLELGPPHGVSAEEAGLGPQMAGQPLEAEEGELYLLRVCSLHPPVLLVPLISDCCSHNLCCVVRVSVCEAFGAVDIGPSNTYSL